MSDIEAQKKKKKGSATGPGHRALPLGPYDPSDPMVLEVSVAGRDALWSFWQSLIGES